MEKENGELRPAEFYKTLIELRDSYSDFTSRTRKYWIGKNGEMDNKLVHIKRVSKKEISSVNYEDKITDYKYQLTKFIEHYCNRLDENYQLITVDFGFPFSNQRKPNIDEEFSAEVAKKGSTEQVKGKYGGFGAVGGGLLASLLAIPTGGMSLLFALGGGVLASQIKSGELNEDKLVEILNSMINETSDLVKTKSLDYFNKYDESFRTSLDNLIKTEMSDSFNSGKEMQKIIYYKDKITKLEKLVVT